MSGTQGLSVTPSPAKGVAKRKVTAGASKATDPLPRVKRTKFKATRKEDVYVVGEEIICDTTLEEMTAVLKCCGLLHRTEDFDFVVPTGSHRLSDPLEVHGHLGFYINLAAFEAGFHLPLYSFVAEVLRTYKVAPGQLVGMSYYHIVWFCISCLQAGEEPLLPVFRSIYTFSASNQNQSPRNAYFRAKPPAMDSFVETFWIKKSKYIGVFFKRPASAFGGEYPFPLKWCLAASSTCCARPPLDAREQAYMIGSWELHCEVVLWKGSIRLPMCLSVFFAVPIISLPLGVWPRAGEDRLACISRAEVEEGPDFWPTYTCLKNHDWATYSSWDSEESEDAGGEGVGGRGSH